MNGYNLLQQFQWTDKDTRVLNINLRIDDSALFIKG
jgi:hypothetical protein